MSEKQPIKKVEPKLVKKAEPKNTISKRDKFTKNANFRANKVIERLSLLGQMAQNPQNYDYSEKDIETIFDRIDEMSLRMREKFLSTVKSSTVAEDFKVNLE